MSSHPRIRGRQAHTPGVTCLAYTPNGKKLITVGVDNFCRIFTHGSDDEPVTIDDCQENNTAVVAGNDFFVTGSEDGTVCKYSLEDNKLEEILVRTSLPVRDIALSPDRNWVAVASDELVVKLVSIKDMTHVQYLREQSRAAKHVAFDSTGSHLAVSCTDGIIYVYSLGPGEPRMVRKVDGMIKSLESDAEATSKVFWHPDGRAFATPTPTREMQVMSFHDWAQQRVFKTGHTADITSAAWSPNGAILATTSSDLKLIIWDASTQKVLIRYDDIKATVLAVAWHPNENILSYTNNDGELFIHTDFVPKERASLLAGPLQPAPFIHEPGQSSAEVGSKVVNGTRHVLPERHAHRAGTPDSLDEILGPDALSDDGMDGFVVDDDGAGYAPPSDGQRKRTNGHLAPLHSPPGKRRAHHSSILRPEIHEAFQPGSTPWRGDRRYLCVNQTGWISTHSNEINNEISVDFFDRGSHRAFHFPDLFFYDKACLNDNGALFSAQPRAGTPAIIFYRPHETWTMRTEWRTNLPTGEAITALALSDSYIVVTTSSNYIRIYTLFGIPFRVYRQKASPAVTCAAWRDYVLTIGNGPVSGNGTCQLLYTIENVKRDEIHQSEDIVALPPNTTLNSVFFSDEGEPYIYDSNGVLLTLLHWRANGQARWVPMLDTKLMARLASGNKQESYWAMGVLSGKFQCIILKGLDEHPYVGDTLIPSEFDLEIPLTSTVNRLRGTGRDVDAMSDDEGEEPIGKNKQVAEQQRLEQTFILTQVLHTQLSSTLSHTHSSASSRKALTDLEVQIDRTLLQLLGLECLAGEERGMKALELVSLMKDANGKMLDLASKVATRYGREVLGEKIRELADRRILDIHGEDD